MKNDPIASIMLFSNIYFLVFASCFVLLVSPVHGGALSWGQFLGADWLEAEGELTTQALKYK